MIRLALLRHGHTGWNRTGRIQGRSDITLDDEARADLAAMALPPAWQKAQIWSSPLARAVETAQLVAERSPAQDTALIEMNWGAWEGLRGIDLKARPDADYRDIENWGWHFRPPGGESPADMRDRLLPWIASLTDDSVAVCHIGVMRVILAVATGWGFVGPAPFQIKRNRLFIVEIDGRSLQHNGAPVRLIRRGA